MNAYKLKRLKLDLTQYDVAKQTGIHQSRLSLIENGYVKPNANERAKIEEFLNPKAKQGKTCRELVQE